MPHTRLSRREFLKLGSASLFSLLSPTIFAAHSPPGEPAVARNPRPAMKARITTKGVNVYQDLNFKSTRVGSLKRDEVVLILEEIISPDGPAHNPHWYKLSDGYIHSGYTQRVDKAHLNTPLTAIPEGGQLGEISLPYVDSLRQNRKGKWNPLYRLYFTSMHWITGLEEGPDGCGWYVLTDDLLHVKYIVPASSVRPIPEQELEPISPGVPDKDKRIVVSIGEQLVTAYEGEQIVLQTKMSSGVHTKNLPADVLPTDTPTGYFHIQVKVPSRHMGDGRLTSDIEAYELLGVAWVSFFHQDGIAFHGTYWHDNFGRKMSHGCINMRNEDARWLYLWSQPFASPRDWNKKGYGTFVHIEN
jgi:hypothetical protein